MCEIKKKNSVTKRNLRYFYLIGDKRNFNLRLKFAYKLILQNDV